MTHLTMEQLLELNQPGLEPGQASACEHLQGCPRCQAESDRLSQRVARLKALPTPRPSRDQFLEIRARHVKERRNRTVMRSVTVVLALAAAIAIALVLRPMIGGVQPGPGGDELAAERELETVRARSQLLEEELRQYNPESRAIDGRTAAIAARLEDQVSSLDRQLELLDLMDRRDPMRNERQLRLWRERVGLLDALVDVHVTRASYAEF
jgi:anti-sigma factor RsiW